MSWHLVRHSPPGGDILETVYEGMVSPVELEAAVNATLADAVRHPVLRFLADCTTLRGGHSLGDLYAIVSRLERTDRPPRMREAILAPHQVGMAQEVRAYETMCLNRGIVVKVFQDRAEALDWLGEA